MKTIFLSISWKNNIHWNRSSFIPPLLLFATLLFFIILVPKVFAELIVEKVYDFSMFGGDTSKLTIYNNKLYFVASDGNTGLELWESDGTQVGTYPVIDINSAGDSSPTGLFVYHNRLYFGANDGEFGNELWTSDGTSTGTFLVKDINPTGDSFPAWMNIYHDQLYFSANNGVDNINRELWVSDGTSVGTKLLKELNVGDSNVTWLTTYKDKLYFNASYGKNSKQFWVSDGIDAQLFGSALNGLYDPQEFMTFQDKLYFKANDQISGYELWVTDGTFEGTHLVKDIFISKYSYTGSDLSWLTAFNNRLYFRANDQIVGQELWTSDGTEEGTQLVKDINPFSGEGSYPEWFAMFNGQLFFTADDGISGRELWFTDGTSIGTQPFPEDVNPEGSSGAKWLIVLNNKLYFITSSPPALWVLHEPVPPTLVVPPSSQTLSIGQTVMLEVMATGDLPLSYQWYQGESGDTSFPIAEATTTHLTIPHLMTTTSYWVRVTNKVGSVDSPTASITVVSSPSSQDASIIPKQKEELLLPSPSSSIMPSYFTAFVEVHGPGEITSLPVGLHCSWQYCQKVNQDATGMSCQTQECSKKIPSLSTFLMFPHPESRAVFSSWGGHPDCEDGKVTARSSFLCIAYFHKLSKLTVTGIQYGVVTSSPEGIQCGDQNKQCEHFFEVGKDIQLSFTPKVLGWLNGWSGECNHEGKIKIGQSDQECSPQFLMSLQK